jgi:hypothetical protein
MKKRGAKISWSRAACPSTHTERKTAVDKLCPLHEWDPTHNRLVLFVFLCTVMFLLRWFFLC